VLFWELQHQWLGYPSPMFPKENLALTARDTVRERPVRSAQELGKAIAETRRRQHLTQSDLADVAEVNRSRLTKIELGKTTTLLDQLFRLLNLLGLELVVRARNPHRGTAD
jgi:DNA-binding XRE family transcriptional regulator